MGQADGEVRERMDMGTVLGVIGALTVARGCMWIIDLAEGRGK